MQGHCDSIRTSRRFGPLQLLFALYLPQKREPLLFHNDSSFAIVRWVVIWHVYVDEEDDHRLIVPIGLAAAGGQSVGGTGPGVPITRGLVMSIPRLLHKTSQIALDIILEEGINCGNRREAMLSAIDSFLPGGDVVYSHHRLTMVAVDIAELVRHLHSTQ